MQCSQDWWKILLMVNNYTSTCHCLAQAWSVAVEFQLYLLAPWVLFAVWDAKTGQPRRLWWLRLLGFWTVQPIVRIIWAASVTGWDFSVWYLNFNM